MSLEGVYAFEHEKLRFFLSCLFVLINIVAIHRCDVSGRRTFCKVDQTASEADRAAFDERAAHACLERLLDRGAVLLLEDGLEGHAADVADVGDGLHAVSAAYSITME